MLSPDLPASAGSTTSSSAANPTGATRPLEYSAPPRTAVPNLVCPPLEDPWKWDDTDDGEDRGIGRPLAEEEVEEKEEAEGGFR